MTITCKRCNRPLKNHDSQEKGYGHRCFELTFGKEEKKKKMRGYFYGE